MTWGRRFLMCPPDHFDVVYEINPWMDRRVRVDVDRARGQWEDLVATLRSAGAEVDVMAPAEGLPDLVFTANAGIAMGAVFVPARFRDTERRAETPHDVAWFRERGWSVRSLPKGFQEGAGDALPTPGSDGGSLVAGYGVRSQARTLGPLAARLGVEVHPVRLVDPRLYHLDLGYCPLDDRRALVVPAAFAHPSAQRIRELVPEPIELTLEEGLAFVANSVVVGDHVVMPTVPPRVGRRLERAGFSVVEVVVSEFRKAGGACRCLTLPLDLAPVTSRLELVA